MNGICEDDGMRGLTVTSWTSWSNGWLLPPPLSSWRLRPYRPHCHHHFSWMVVIPCLQWSPTPTGLWWLISVHCEILHFAVFLNEIEINEKLDLWIRFACWPIMASAFPSVLAGASYRGARGLLKRIKVYIPSDVLLQCKQIVSLFYVCFNQEHWFYLWLPTKCLFMMRNTFCLFMFICLLVFWTVKFMLLWINVGTTFTYVYLYYKWNYILKALTTECNILKN